MGLGICVHDAHVMNTVSPILLEVEDQEVALLFRGLYRWRGGCECCGFGPDRILLWPLHGATCEDEGVVAHVRGGENISGQVCDHVTELIVTCRDKSAPLTVKVTADVKSGVAEIAEMREVWGI